MPDRYDTYSLKQLLLKLHDEFPNIVAVYLFGSRRHRTLSARSDVDLLLRLESPIRSEEIRDFALEHCPALDFFLIDGASATSCANGSQVRAASLSQLVTKLDAIKVWSARDGFPNVEVDWHFDVIKGLNPMMTTLVSSVPFPSKAENVADHIIEPPSRDRVITQWDKLKQHPLYIIAGTSLLVASATFKIIQEVRIVPLKERIEWLEHRLNEPSDDAKSTIQADSLKSLEAIESDSAK